MRARTLKTILSNDIDDCPCILCTNGDHTYDNSGDGHEANDILISNL